MPTVSVVIPTLNEARNLPHVLPFLPQSVDEVIVVDGRSVDDTVEIARQLLPDVRIVMERERGKGAALRAGFRAATSEIVVALDADGSTDPTEIPRFVEALVAGADYVKGSRFLPLGGTADMSRLRSFGNRCFVLLVRLMFRARYTDLCYGYNAFWRRALPVVEPNCSGFEVETAMNLRAVAGNLRVIEVPSFERPRIYGTSNLRTFSDGWRVLKTIFRERFARRPPAVTAPAGFAPPVHGAGFDDLMASTIAIGAPGLVPVMAEPFDDVASPGSLSVAIEAAVAEASATVDAIAGAATASCDRLVVAIPAIGWAEPAAGGGTYRDWRARRRSSRRRSARVPATAKAIGPT